MGTLKTSYEYGMEYAEWMQANEPDGAHSVDIDTMLGGTVDIPEGDYHDMRANGVEPNARQYWEGFNSVFI